LIRAEAVARSGDPNPAPVFSQKKSIFFSDVNFELKKILADNPPGLLLVAIKRTT
jgi:hypothetical protein